METNWNDLYFNMSIKSKELKRKRRNKILIILGGLFVFLVVIISITSKPDSNKSISNSSSDSGTSHEKIWTEVYTFTGNGIKKSPVFELTGCEARLDIPF